MGALFRFRNCLVPLRNRRFISHRIGKGANFFGFCGVFEFGGPVHRIADNGIFEPGVVADSAEYYLAGGDRNTDTEL